MFSIQKGFTGPILRKLGDELMAKDEDVLAVRPLNYMSAKSRLAYWLKT